MHKTGIRNYSRINHRHLLTGVTQINATLINHFESRIAKLESYIKKENEADTDYASGD